MCKIENKKIHVPELDVSKGIAIIFMILGHSIQISYGNSDGFFDNIVFKFIYSFHMPLFMMISGYLFNTTVKRKTTKKILIERCSSLLIPLLSWNLIINGKDFVNAGGVLYKIVKFGYHCIVSYWFLWAVLYCSIGSILVFKIVNRKLQIVCLTLLLLATFFTPDLFNSECYKFMFPCFISGYYMKEYGNQIKNTFDYKKGLLIGAVLFTALFMFYKRNGYIYIGYWSLLRKGAVGIFIWDIYRTIIGIIGSVCILLSVRIFIPLKENGVIQEIGKNSMGIYIISMQLNIVLRWLAVRFNITWWGMIIETIAILAISYLTTKVISKIKILNFLLLGRRKNE